MKRILCAILALLLCFAFVACAEETETKKKTTKKSDSKETVTQEEEPVDEEKPMTPEEFFDNAAFIGDSVTLKLRNYNTANGVLGKTTFLCQGSYSVAHAVNDTMYLSYQGNDITPQDALLACEADRVFILLGMNDIALYGIEKTIEHWGILVANIREKCPEIDIYIQAGTPIYKSGEVGSLNNENMNKYNVQLQAFAAANDCYFVETNSIFKDSTGGLAEEYCSDSFVHFTDAACKLWVDTLMTLVK